VLYTESISDYGYDGSQDYDEGGSTINWGTNATSGTRSASDGTFAVDQSSSLNDGGSIHLAGPLGPSLNSLDDQYGDTGNGTLHWDKTASWSGNGDTPTGTSSSTGSEDWAVSDDFGDLPEFYAVDPPPIPGMPGSLFDDLEVRATRGY